MSTFGLHPPEAAVDALLDSRGAPRLPCGVAHHVTALGCQDVLGAAMGHGLPDELLGARVARRRVEEGDAAVERCFQHPAGTGYVTVAMLLLALDLGQAESQSGDLETGPSKRSRLQGLYVALGP